MAPGTDPNLWMSPRLNFWLNCFAAAGIAGSGAVVTAVVGDDPPNVAQWIVVGAVSMGQFFKAIADRSSQPPARRMPRPPKPPPLILPLLVGLLVVATAVWAIVPFSATVAVTATATDTAMDFGVQGVRATSGVVTVTAGDPVYVQFNTTATVTGAPLQAGESVSWSDYTVRMVSTICDTGQSATVVIRALP